MDMLHSKDFPDSFFRVAIKGICVRDGKILLLKEADSLAGKWELPGGGLDFGEEPHVALRREINEETGLTVTSISEKPMHVWTARFDKRRDLDWYYSLCVGYQIEFENLEFSKSEECQEIGFFSKEELDGIELAQQSFMLRDFFDPKDFA